MHAELCQVHVDGCGQYLVQVVKHYEHYSISFDKCYSSPIRGHCFHRYYTVGGKCMYHPHTMATGSTLRQLGARFLKGNCALLIDGFDSFSSFCEWVDLNKLRDGFISMVELTNMVPNLYL